MRHCWLALPRRRPGPSRCRSLYLARYVCYAKKLLLPEQRMCFVQVSAALSSLGVLTLQFASKSDGMADAVARTVEHCFAGLTQVVTKRKLVDSSAEAEGRDAHGVRTPAMLRVQLWHDVVCSLLEVIARCSAGCAAARCVALWDENLGLLLDILSNSPPRCCRLAARALHRALVESPDGVRVHFPSKVSLLQESWSAAKEWMRIVDGRDMDDVGDEFSFGGQWGAADVVDFVLNLTALIGRVPEPPAKVVASAGDVEMAAADDDLAAALRLSVSGSDDMVSTAAAVAERVAVASGLMTATLWGPRVLCVASSAVWLLRALCDQGGLWRTLVLERIQSAALVPDAPPASLSSASVEPEVLHRCGLTMFSATHTASIAVQMQGWCKQFVAPASRLSALFAFGGFVDGLRVGCRVTIRTSIDTSMAVRSRDARNNWDGPRPGSRSEPLAGAAKAVIKAVGLLDEDVPSSGFILVGFAGGRAMLANGDSLVAGSVDELQSLRQAPISFGSVPVQLQEIILAAACELVGQVPSSSRQKPKEECKELVSELEEKLADDGDCSNGMDDGSVNLVLCRMAAVKTLAQAFADPAVVQWFGGMLRADTRGSVANQYALFVRHLLQLAVIPTASCGLSDALDLDDAVWCALQHFMAVCGRERSGRDGVQHGGAPSASAASASVDEEEEAIRESSASLLADAGSLFQPVSMPGLQMEMASALGGRPSAPSPSAAPVQGQPVPVPESLRQFFGMVGVGPPPVSENVGRLVELGIRRSWAIEALRQNADDFDRALAFVFENGPQMDAIVAAGLEARAAEDHAREAAREAELIAHRAELIAHRAAVQEVMEAQERRRQPRPGVEAMRMLRGRVAMDSGADGTGSFSFARMVEMGMGAAVLGGPGAFMEDSDDAASGDAAEGVMRRSMRRAAGLERGVPDARRSALPIRTTPGKSALAAADARGADALVILSGHVTITDELVVTGSPAERFPTVSAAGLLLHSGKWYYELLCLSDGDPESGNVQVGWVDGAFVADSEHGSGVGDDGKSWAYDGTRQLQWHQTSSSWGSRWQAGDVVGVAVDIEARTMSFSLNGSFEAPMGVAFRGFTFYRGIMPAVSMGSSESYQLNFGGRDRPLWFAPPDTGYRAIDDAFTEFSSGVMGMTQAGYSYLNPTKVVADRFEHETADVDADHRYSDGTFVPCRAHRIPNHPIAGYDRNNRYNTSTPEGCREALIDSAVTATIVHARQVLVELIAHWPVNGLPLSLEDCALGERVGGGPSLPSDYFRRVVCHHNNDHDDFQGVSDEEGAGLVLELLKLVSWESVNNITFNTRRSYYDIPTVAPLTLVDESLRASVWASYKSASAGRPRRVRYVPGIGLSGGPAEVKRPAAGLVNGILCFLERFAVSASSSRYASVVWRQYDIAPRGLVDGIHAEAWSDVEAREEINIPLALCLTELLIELACVHRNLDAIECHSLGDVMARGSLSWNATFCAREGASIDFDLALGVFNVWATLLRSPNVSIKERVARVLSSILEEAIADVRAARGGATEAAMRERLGRFIACLSLERLTFVVLRRLDFERPNGSWCTSYLQAMTELLDVCNTASDLCPAHTTSDALAVMIAQTVSSVGGSDAADFAEKGQLMPTVAGVIDSACPWRLVADGYGFGTEVGIAGDMDSGVGGVRFSGTMQVTLRDAPPELAVGSSVSLVKDSSSSRIGTIESIAKDKHGSVIVRWSDGANTTQHYGGAVGDVVIVEVVDGRVVKRHAVGRKPAFFGVIVKLIVVSAGVGSGDGGALPSRRVGGVVEYPDFRAVVGVDGSWDARAGKHVLTLTERELVTGQPCAGWGSLLGTEGWTAGAVHTLECAIDEASEARRWPAGATGTWSGCGGPTMGTVRIQRLRLFDFDEHAVGQRVRVTADGQTASVAGGGELRSMVLGNVGFSSGVHYWEVRITCYVWRATCTAATDALRVVVPRFSLRAAIMARSWSALLKSPGALQRGLHRSTRGAAGVSSISAPRFPLGERRHGLRVHRARLSDRP